MRFLINAIAISFLFNLINNVRSIEEDYNYKGFYIILIYKYKMKKNYSNLNFHKN